MSSCKGPAKYFEPKKAIENFAGRDRSFVAKYSSWQHTGAGARQETKKGGIQYYRPNILAQGIDFDSPLKYVGWGARRGSL